MGQPLDDILRHPAIWRLGQLAQDSRQGIASGYAPLDAVLPGHGWPRGALTEILADQEGVGELSLLTPVLRRLSDEAKGVALIAPPYVPCARAWEARGIRLDRMLVIEAGGSSLLWAAEQALRSGACGVVVIWACRTQTALAHRALQRLHLAAGKGEALCFLYRPAHAASAPSPAPLRLALASEDGRLALKIIKRRGALLPAAVCIAPFPVHWRDTAAARDAMAPADAAQPVALRFPRLETPAH